MKTVVKIAMLLTLAALLTSFAAADTPGAHPLGAQRPRGLR